MPILGILASSKLKAAATSYESIATVTVGSGGASNVEFTSIPSTYTHLQIRGIAQDNGGGTDRRILVMRINSDSGANYAEHSILGNGATVSASATASNTYMTLSQITESGTNASMFGGFVIDILDYKNTNKYKTIRAIGGNDTNNTTQVGAVSFNSGLWMNTNAISSLTFDLRGTLGGSFSQYSHFALYGIKSA